MDVLEANGELFFMVCSLVGAFLLLVGFVLNSIVGAGGLGDFLDSADDLLDQGDMPRFDGAIDDVISGELPSIFLDTPIGEFDVPVPSFLSFRILRVVLLVFGVTGNIAFLYLEWSFWESFGLGLVSGFSSGYIVYRGLVYVYKQTIYHSRDPQIIGRVGKVMLEIPSEGMGQIMIDVAQQRQLFRAESANNQIIPNHSRVKVIRKRKGVCIVVPYNREH